ncbi:MAG TPA: hypothetical protein VGO62_21195 [Myxococcota bacterium]
MRSRLLVLSIAAIALAACPSPPPPPAAQQPLKVTVTIAPDAPVPDPAQAPATSGILPSGVPDDVQVFDLGDVAIKDGASSDIFVDVKSGLGAMTVLVYGQPSATVILSRAVDPDGTLVVSDVPLTDVPDSHLLFAQGFPSQVFSVNRVFGSLDSGAFLVPNTPSVAPQSGRWKLRVGQFSVDPNESPAHPQALDQPVHVVILVKGQDTGKGSIDLNLHFTGANGLTAATAPSDALLSGALDVVKQAYAQVHIDIGAIHYLDIDPSFQGVSLAAGRCSNGDLDRVVAQGQGDEPGLGLFFIDHFACIVDGVDRGSNIGGSAAGIPGEPWVQGSSHAGVAVSVAFAAGDPTPLGVVMAHETGHFLGLYHDQESNLGSDTITDEIDDTPSGAGAATNLMYFAASDSTDLTEGQGTVMRANPWVIAR